MNAQDYENLVKGLKIDREESQTLSEQALRIRELELELELLKAKNTVTQPEFSTEPSLLFNRFYKHGMNGEKISSDAPNWAGIADLNTGLMWANNWHTEDDFPCREGTWYQTGDGYCENNYDETWNHGINTENIINIINRRGWMGYHDWRLPTVDELKTLIYRHDVKNDVLGQDENKQRFLAMLNTSRFWHWSSSPYALNSNIAFGVHFTYGSDYSGSKYGSHYVRAVRSV